MVKLRLAKHSKKNLRRQAEEEKIAAEGQRVRAQARIK
jgi:hypothetical protein